MALAMALTRLPYVAQLSSQSSTTMDTSDEEGQRATAKQQQTEPDGDALLSPQASDGTERVE